VVRVNPTTGAMSTVYTFPTGTYSNSPGGAYGITSDSNWIYVAVLRSDNNCCGGVNTTRQIYKVAYDGSTASVLVTDNGMALYGLESAGDYLYGASSLGAVRRYTKADGTIRDVGGGGPNGSVDGVGTDAWLYGGPHDIA